MIRFLEDRKILPNKYFSDISEEGFLGVLHSPITLLTALDRLAKDFNGGGFKKLRNNENECFSS